MEAMLVLFSCLSDVDVSYKIIERLYSDQDVLCALQQEQVSKVKKKLLKVHLQWQKISMLKSRVFGSIDIIVHFQKNKSESGITQDKKDVVGNWDRKKKIDLILLTFLRYYGTTFTTSAKGILSYTQSHH